LLHLVTALVKKQHYQKQAYAWLSAWQGRPSFGNEMPSAYLGPPSPPTTMEVLVGVCTSGWCL